MAFKYPLFSLLLSILALFCQATSSNISDSAHARTIDCTPFERGRGTLKVAKVSSDGDSLQEVVPMHFVDGKLEEDTQDAEEVRFYPCESSFMQRMSDSNVLYGHVSLASDPSKCLSTNLAHGASRDIKVMECYYGDNSLQMLQYWKLVLSDKSSEPSLIYFVGRSKRLADDRTFPLDMEGKEGQRHAMIDIVHGSNAVPKFQLLLEPMTHQQPMIVQDYALF